MDLSALDPKVLEFLAAIAGSLATIFAACVWPLALVFLSLFFRRPIVSTLSYLSRFKGAGFELEFEQRIRELEREADESDIPKSVEPLQESLKTQVSRLRTMAEISPRTAILESWLFVESAITEAAVRLGLIEPGGGSVMAPTFIRAVTQKIDSSMELFFIVKELRQLRNKAVHEFDFDIRLDQAHEYIDLSVRVVNVISGRAATILDQS